MTNHKVGRFRPNDFLSRKEAAAILMRTAQTLGKKTSGEGKNFTDAELIASWAVEPVAFVTSAGIMNGSNNKFDPNRKFNREQAYITMMNSFDNL